MILFPNVWLNSKNLRILYTLASGKIKMAARTFPSSRIPVVCARRNGEITTRIPKLRHGLYVAPRWLRHLSHSAGIRAEVRG